MVDKLSVPLQNLENDLTEYLKDDEPEFQFDVSKVATIVTKVPQVTADTKKKTPAQQAAATAASSSAVSAGSKRPDVIPELEPYGLGTKLASSRLTEVRGFSLETNEG